MTLTRAIYSLVLIVAMAFAAMFAITSYSDAQEPQPELTCPAGTVLSADGTLCLSEAVNDNVVTTTSCVQGVLSDDGKFCVVPRTDAAPAPAAPAAPGAAPIEAPIPTFTG